MGGHTPTENQHNPLALAAERVDKAIFGHFGDRIGRKKTLVTTLLITGFATFAVDLVPTYASIGIWGAVLLTILRLIQGVGVGGEWGGSVLLSMESARTNAHRGFIAAWPQFGAPAGLLLATLAMLAFSAISGDQFLVWGWRIPFLLSIIMVGVGLYIRLRTLEPPSFRRLLAENRIERTPALEVIKRRPKLILLTAFAKMGEQGPGAIYHTFVFTYGLTVLHSSRDFLLMAWAIDRQLESSGAFLEATAFAPEAMDQVSPPIAIFSCNTSAGESAPVPRRRLSTPPTMIRRGIFNSLVPSARRKAKAAGWYAQTEGDDDFLQ